MTRRILTFITLIFLLSSCSDDNKPAPTPSDPTVPPVFCDYGDCYREYQDYLDLIDVPAAWEITKGEGVKVMVFDNAIQKDHEDLAGISVYNIITGTSSASPSKKSEFSFHGTAVSGIIAARENNYGIVGIAPECDYLFIGDQTEYFSDANIIKAFDYAKKQGVKVISCSWGSYNYSSTFESVMKNMYESGITVFFSAGNNGLNIDIPSIKYGNINDEAESQWVIGVSSSNRQNTKSSFSNYGENIDIMAPGENILTTDLTDDEGDNYFPLNNNYTFASGTSFSSPIAAGVAALMLSVNPSLTPEQVRLIITETATKTSSGFSLQNAHGVINAERAVKKAAGINE